MKKEAGWQKNPTWDFLEKIFGYKMAVNLYPPFFAAGISISQADSDFKFIEVEMKMSWFNRNYVGTHFGGSLYAMCDPFYMFMLIYRLGSDYIIWDKSATIDFLKPGDGTVKAIFAISDEEIDSIRHFVKENRKMDKEFHTFIYNQKNERIAKVKKILYIRKKR